MQQKTTSQVQIDTQARMMNKVVEPPDPSSSSVWSWWKHIMKASTVRPQQDQMNLWGACNTNMCMVWFFVQRKIYFGLVSEVKAPYVAEEIRRYMIQEYGLRAYSEGLEVYTTINSKFQNSWKTSNKKITFTWVLSGCYLGVTGCYLDVTWVLPTLTWLMVYSVCI